MKSSTHVSSAPQRARPAARPSAGVSTGEGAAPFVPQTKFLSLISTGDRYAVASRGRLAVQGALLWTFKDWIDRRWMRQYQELPSQRVSAAVG